MACRNIKYKIHLYERFDTSFKARDNMTLVLYLPKYLINNVRLMLISRQVKTADNIFTNCTVNHSQSLHTSSRKKPNLYQLPLYTFGRAIIYTSRDILIEKNEKLKKKTVRSRLCCLWNSI